MILLMVQKSQTSTCYLGFHPMKNGDIIHINWLAGFLPSTVCLMAGQPTPPQKEGLINRWFPLIRPY